VRVTAAGDCPVLGAAHAHGTRGQCERSRHEDEAGDCELISTKSFLPEWEAIYARQDTSSKTFLFDQSSYSFLNTNAMQYRSRPLL
jgi:hypothetical protein